MNLVGMPEELSCALRRSCQSSSMNGAVLSSRKPVRLSCIVRGSGYAVIMCSLKIAYFIRVFKHANSIVNDNVVFKAE